MTFSLTIMSTFFLVMLALAAATVLYIGWQLRFRQKLELLAGYNPQITHDKKGLAHWAGYTFLGLAPLQWGCVLLALKTGLFLIGCLAYVGVSCIALLVLALGAAQYSKLD